MKLIELSKQYDVSLEMLHQCIDAGIIDDLKFDIKDNICEGEVLRRLELSICLYSLGLDTKTIKEYIFLEILDEDTRKTRIEILQKQRNYNLKSIHNTKKTMDYIDRVLHELKVKE